MPTSNDQKAGLHAAADRARPTVVAGSDRPRSPVDALRGIADALCRAAHECCHQRDRSARLLGKTAPADETKAAAELCAVCDRTLERLTASYERAAASIRPEGDPGWWHRANALWMASREYARHHRSCDQLARKLTGKHSAHELEALHLEFELEASALLALRHACGGYCRTRPQAM